MVVKTDASNGRAGRRWTGEQGIDKRWAGKRSEGQEMFLGAKATHPTQFLVLSSRDPNLGVSMLPSTRCEITTKRHLMILESCMTDTNPARTSPLSLPESWRWRSGLGIQRAELHQ